MSTVFTLRRFAFDPSTPGLTQELIEARSNVLFGELGLLDYRDLLGQTASEAFDALLAAAAGGERRPAVAGGAL